MRLLRQQERDRSEVSDIRSRMRPGRMGQMSHTVEAIQIRHATDYFDAVDG